MSKRFSDITLSFFKGDWKISKSTEEKTGSLAVTGADVLSSEIYVKTNTFTNNKSKKNKYADPGDLLMINADHKKENVGRACVYLGKRCLLGNNIFAIKTNQNQKFLAYLTTTKCFKDMILDTCKTSIRSFLGIEDVKQLKIPLPPLDEQERIVKQLDKLHEIAHDVKRGLPKMIELSQKQYEYYKEKLLMI